MTNSIQEVYANDWLNDRFASYGNEKNTFTGGKYKPVNYDYVFHRTNNKFIPESFASKFEMTFFKTYLSKDTEISVSDHEGIDTTIKIWNPIWKRWF